MRYLVVVQSTCQKTTRCADEVSEKDGREDRMKMMT